MTSSKPYLIRALYEWISDNNCTPYITVNANFPRVDIPQTYAVDGWITLDISATAMQQLLIDNRTLTGKARFGGMVHNLYIPVGSIVAIYAQETKHGMNFPKEEWENTDNSDTTSPSPSDNVKPKFQIIKGGKD